MEEIRRKQVEMQSFSNEVGIFLNYKLNIEFTGREPLPGEAPGAVAGTVTVEF